MSVISILNEAKTFNFDRQLARDLNRIPPSGWHCSTSFDGDEWIADWISKGSSLFVSSKAVSDFDYVVVVSGEVKVGSRRYSISDFYIKNKKIVSRNKAAIPEDDVEDTVRFIFSVQGEKLIKNEFARQSGGEDLYGILFAKSSFDYSPDFINDEVYQIKRFFPRDWKVDKPVSNAVRATYNGGNAGITILIMKLTDSDYPEYTVEFKLNSVGDYFIHNRESCYVKQNKIVRDSNSGMDYTSMLDTLEYLMSPRGEKFMNNSFIQRIYNKVNKKQNLPYRYVDYLSYV